MSFGLFHRADILEERLVQLLMLYEREKIELKKISIRHKSHTRTLFIRSKYVCIYIRLFHLISGRKLRPYCVVYFLTQQIAIEREVCYFYIKK